MGDNIKNEGVEKIVKEAISSILSVSIEEIQIDSLLGEELGMDSFGAVELIFELKDKFGVEIPQEDFKKIKKVKDVIEYISNNLSRG